MGMCMCFVSDIENRYMIIEISNMNNAANRALHTDLSLEVSSAFIAVYCLDAMWADEKDTSSCGG